MERQGEINGDETNAKGLLTAGVSGNSVGWMGAPVSILRSGAGSRIRRSV